MLSPVATLSARHPRAAGYRGSDFVLWHFFPNAKTDAELLKVWLKSHQDGSAHTIRVYKRVGERFLAAFAATGSGLRKRFRLL
jgi:hypothetical protein